MNKCLSPKLNWYKLNKDFTYAIRFALNKDFTNISYLQKTLTYCIDRYKKGHYEVKQTYHIIHDLRKWTRCTQFTGRVESTEISGGSEARTNTLLVAGKLKGTQYLHLACHLMFNNLVFVLASNPLGILLLSNLPVNHMQCVYTLRLISHW